LQVTISSNNTNLLLISSSPTAAGTNAVQIPLPAGGFNGTYYLQGLASSGTATYTVSASGFASFTGTVSLTPSGVVVGDGVNPGNLIFGSSAVVSMAQLDPATNQFVQIEQLAGGLPAVHIAMSTTLSGVTITTPVTIAAGTDSATATLTGSSGSGTVTATTPPGFTDSNFLTVSIFFF